MLTEEDARRLLARSRINRASRGLPIMPKNRKRAEAYGEIRNTKRAEAYGEIRDTKRAEAFMDPETDERVDGSGIEADEEYTSGVSGSVPDREERVQDVPENVDYKNERDIWKPKKSKYGNTRTEVDGKKFDSKHEAEIYQQLRMMLRAGEIKAVIRQVPFDLPGGIRYFADFGVIYPDDRVEFWDAKSPATAKNRVYINKKKQMMSEWRIEVREV